GGMDGIALTREIAKLHPESKILLTSGFPGKRLADNDDLGKAVRLLSKPYRKADLIKAIREVLNDETKAAVRSSRERVVSEYRELSGGNGWTCGVASLSESKS